MTLRNASAFISGAIIGVLGGLIGLGGAEFRLPVLLSAFQFAALEAVILNKATSLVVVAFALPFRARSISFDLVLQSWPIVVNLLSGSLLGAWVGAGYATGLNPTTLRRIIAVLLASIAVILVAAHGPTATEPPLHGIALITAGVIAGLAIGIVAALLGVAGGELLIPTLVLLFGVDIKLAGSLSLAISLPTMLAGFARYSRDRSFVVLSQNRRFITVMACGSIVGAFIGGLLLQIVPSGVLIPILALILIISSVKTWRHRERASHSGFEPFLGNRNPGGRDVRRTNV